MNELKKFYKVTIKNDTKTETFEGTLSYLSKKYTKFLKEDFDTTVLKAVDLTEKDSLNPREMELSILKFLKRIVKEPTKFTERGLISTHGVQSQISNNYGV